MQLRNKDLNLLVLFDCIAEELQLSRAAKRVGLSQPAMSRSLQRLREEFDDPLFTRTSQGLIPTRKSIQLLPQIKRILAESSRLYEQEKFEISRAEGTIVIAGTDFIDYLLMPPVVSRVMRDAPKLKVVTRTVGSTNPTQDLEKGQFDIGIAGFFTDLKGSLYRSKLFTENFAGLVRKNHPILRRSSVGIEDYVAYPHLLISPHGTLEGVVDQILAKKGLKRHVQFAIANFQTPGRIIESSDLILTAPSRLITQFCKDFEVRSFKLPLKIPGFTVSQVWHERTHHNPLHQWFRAQLQAIAKDVYRG